MANYEKLPSQRRSAFADVFCCCSTSGAAIVPSDPVVSKGEDLPRDGSCPSKYQDYGKGVGRDEPMFIPDNHEYKASDFMMPPHYKSYVDKVLLPRGLVKDRVEKLAYDIYMKYRGSELHLLCILKGARSFFNLLIEYLGALPKYCGEDSSVPPFFEHYVRLKSYSNESSSNQLTIVSDDLSILKDKHVLIVEDCIDTGFTLTKFGEHLMKIGPKSIKVACLVEKRTDRSNGFICDFVGFSVPDHWILGHGFDYNEMFRDYDHVAILTDKAREKFSVSEEAK